MVVGRFLFIPMTISTDHNIDEVYQKCVQEVVQKLSSQTPRKRRHPPPSPPVTLGKHAGVESNHHYRIRTMLVEEITITS